MSIETERLILRQWRDEDLGPFAVLSADPEVMELLMGPIDRAQSDDKVNRYRWLLEMRGFGYLAIEAPGIADFIGVVGLAVSPPELPFAGAIEIGWRLARPYWGQGYATEAATAALGDGFSRLGLTEIVSFTALLNRRSRAVMERLGMIHNPKDDFDHVGVPEADPLRPHVLYRLPRATWEARS